MTKTFMAIGECMVELSPQGGDSYKMGFAGDTFNSAWYARKLAGNDLDVAYLSAVGDDAASLQMEEFMVSAGVRPVLAKRKGQSAGLYMISLQNGERSFSYWRSCSAARSLADDLKELPDLKAEDMVLFSGITLAILPVQKRQGFLDVLSKARRAGVQIVFDPNLRPRLWDSSSEMCEWIMKAAHVADISLPSFEDEAAFFEEANKEETAKRYLSAGARLVLVKDGPLSVLAATSERELEVTPKPVQNVVDTTAAGDSFNAGFLTSYLKGEPLEAAVAHACAISAKVIGAKGALVDI